MSFAPPRATLAPGFVPGVFSFVLSVLFVPGLSSPAHSPRWALLSVALPLALVVTEIRMTVAHALGLVFMGWAAVTLTWSSGFHDGLFSLWTLCLLGMAFVIGAEMRTLRPVVIGYGLAMAANSMVLMAQLWAGLQVPQVQCCAALYVNPVFLAEPAAMALAGAVGYRLWWLVPGILPSLLLTGARGPLLALGAAGLAWLWTRNKIAAVVIALALTLAGLWMITSGAHNNSAGQRVTLWADTIRGMTPFGNGIGSFYVNYPSHAPNSNTLITRPTHAHNDMLELVYEIGPGVIPLGALLLFVIAGHRVPERSILIVFLAAGLVSFPLHFPTTLFLAGLAAGRLCRGRLAVRDWFADRRISLRRRMAPRFEAYGSRSTS